MDLLPFILEHEVSILMCFFLLFQSCIVYVVGSRIFFHFLYVLMKNVMLFPCNTSKTFSPLSTCYVRNICHHLVSAHSVLFYLISSAILELFYFFFFLMSTR